MMHMPPTTQLPPTPGSVGSRPSSGGMRTPPSHSPPPSHNVNQTTWSFDDQFKQVEGDRVSDMEQEDGPDSGGRNSPVKPAPATVGGPQPIIEGEDILAKLKQQVSAASLFNARENLNSSSNPGSPNATTNNNNNNNNGHNLYDRLHSLLQNKMKKEDGSGDEDSRDLVLRAEALQRQREALLSSPQVLMNAMRGGGPPSMVPPGGPHFLGLLPVPPQPPTPGSAGSRESSTGGGGARSPSHTPEGHQGHQSWGFDDHFKQVGNSVGNTAIASFHDQIKQLYELSDDIKRKEFLDDIFAFMQKRGTPINRLPIMAKQVLDLYELYNLVVARGGLVEVINKKLWQEIIKGLKLPSSITSAAFTLRTQYTKYLYPYECEKMKLSNPAELQCAIDGNRREGRRSSYGMDYPGPYGDGMPAPPFPFQNLQSLQNLQNLQNPLLRPQLNGTATSPHPLAPQDYLLGRGGSPPGSQEALLEATRLTMWKLYNQGLVGGNHPVLGGLPPNPMGGPGGPGGGGPNCERDEPPKPTPPPPPHHPLVPPFPPQHEALNLEVKDERPRMKSPGSIGIRPEEHGVPPAAKRQASHDDSIEMRLPPPNALTPTGVPSSQGGANIKITSRGDGRSSDQSLVVSMEINGILYQGVLFAQAPRLRFS